MITFTPPARRQRVQCSKVPPRRDNTDYNETSLIKEKLRVDERRAPAARGWGREEASGAGPDFGQTPDQDPAIFSIWWHRVCSILTTPSVTSSIVRRVAILKKSFLAPEGTQRLTLRLTAHPSQRAYGGSPNVQLVSKSAM